MTCPPWLVAVLLLFGAIVGVVASALFAIHWWTKPEHARDFMLGIYERHKGRAWKQCEGARVCPCCGWHEQAAEEIEAQS
jgi:hypothetical protein